MAVSKIEVNTNTLRSDVERVRTELKGLKDDMRKLSEVSAQLNSMWEGEAKQAFIMAVQDDIRRLSELITALEKFTTSTDTARGNYDTCEKNVSSIISSLRV